MMNRVNSSWWIYGGVDATRREASNEVSPSLFISTVLFRGQEREKKATMKATRSLMSIFKGIIKNGSAQRVIRL